MVWGELGNLSELWLLSFAFPECVEDKPTHLPQFSPSALSTVSGREHTGCRSHWMTAGAESEDPTMSSVRRESWTGLGNDLPICELG